MLLLARIRSAAASELELVATTLADAAMSPLEREIYLEVLLTRTARIAPETVDLVRAAYDARRKRHGRDAAV